jgi:hypothetical protein
MALKEGTQGGHPRRASPDMRQRARADLIGGLASLDPSYQPRFGRDFHVAQWKGDFSSLGRSSV